jgi:hypothetical protein
MGIESQPLNPDKDFAELPLGQFAAEQKPAVEEFTHDFLTIQVNRKRDDGVIEVRVQGSQNATHFEIADNKIVPVDVEQYGQDIDHKADEELVQVHGKTLRSLVDAGRI